MDAYLHRAFGGAEHTGDGAVRQPVVVVEQKRNGIVVGELKQGALQAGCPISRLQGWGSGKRVGGSLDPGTSSQAV